MGRFVSATTANLRLCRSAAAIELSAEWVTTAIEKDFAGKGAIGRKCQAKEAGTELVKGRAFIKKPIICSFCGREYVRHKGRSNRQVRRHRKIQNGVAGDKIANHPMAEEVPRSSCRSHGVIFSQFELLAIDHRTHGAGPGYCQR